MKTFNEFLNEKENKLFETFTVDSVLKYQHDQKDKKVMDDILELYKNHKDAAMAHAKRIAKRLANKNTDRSISNLLGRTSYVLKETNTETHPISLIFLNEIGKIYRNNDFSKRVERSLKLKGI